MFSPRHIKSVTNSFKRRNRRREMFDACCRLFLEKKRSLLNGVGDVSHEAYRIGVKKTIGRRPTVGGRKKSRVVESESKRRGGGGVVRARAKRPFRQIRFVCCFCDPKSKVFITGDRRVGRTTAGRGITTFVGGTCAKRNRYRKNGVGYRRLVYVSAVSPERDFRTIATRRI